MPNYPPISNIQERIENSIFHWVRKKIVEEGYLPDILTFPNTDAGTAAYKAAISAIVASNKKFAIEIFNVASSQANEVKRVPRMVLRHRLNLPGSIGGPDGPTYYVANSGNDGYFRVRFPGRSSDLYYDIHLVSNSGKQNWVLHAIVEACFRGARYIPFYDNPLEHFYIVHISHRDYPNTIEGIIENVYSFKVSDIYLIEPLIYDEPGQEIAQIICICLDIYLADYVVHDLWNKTCSINFGVCGGEAWLDADGEAWLLNDGTAWLLPNNNINH
jgi:hypothetical protein